MSKSLILDYIRVVLVEPSHPDNVGAVARLCRNFEAGGLSIVGCQSDPRQVENVWSIARERAHDVLKEAVLYPTLPAALAGQETIVGFSKPLDTGRKQGLFLKDLFSLLQQNKPTAFVFGRESSGLSNQELELCSYVCEVPTSSFMHSINLSHAVGIVLSRAFESFCDQTKSCDRTRGASFEDLEGFYQHIEQVFVHLGFTLAGNPKRMIQRLRGIFSKSQLNYHDVQLLRGVCTKIVHKIKHQSTQERL